MVCFHTESCESRPSFYSCFRFYLSVSVFLKRFLLPLIHLSSRGKKCVSCSYLLRGEPKTWYGVPGACADAFEVAMQAEALELFAHSPNILPHVITLVPPDRLLHRDVPVYHLDQLAGEFVVTFPRAYHAGYNNGFNFAETVNFCPTEWVNASIHFFHFMLFLSLRLYHLAYQL